MKLLTVIVTVCFCLAACAPAHAAPTIAAQTPVDGIGNLNTGRPSIGLVLSGGGARGMAHIGTLKMIDSLGIHVDYVAGTSMGGILGALYAVGYSGEELEKLALETNWITLFTDATSPSALPWNRRRDKHRYVFDLEMDNWKPHIARGLIAGQALSLFFSELTFDAATVNNFDELPKPLRCVAIDLATGCEVVLGSGSLARAMRATMAMPTIFSPVGWGDSLLVDGGTKNNLPVDVCRDMGADLIIASDVTKLRPNEDLRSAIDVLGQWLSVAGETRRRQNALDADYLVQPDVMKYTMTDFVTSRIVEVIRLGENAARRELADLASPVKTTADPGLDDEPFRAPSSPFMLRRLTVTGNHHQPTSLITGMLDLHPGDPLLAPDLRRRIERLHGLGYFAIIDYTLHPVGDGYADLQLCVRESSPQQLLLGLSYDDLHKIIINAGARATNRLLSGLLLEADLQCVGLFRFHGRASLPARTLDFPVYPLIEVESHTIPTDQYDTRSEVVARFNDRSTTVAAGIGLNCAGWLNLESTVRREYLDMNVDVGDDQRLGFLADDGKLNIVRAKLTLDTLDNALQPRHGLLLRTLYDHQFAAPGQAESWCLTTAEADLYYTIGRRHTLRAHAFAGSSQSLPDYKYVGQARPDLFAGLELDQLRGDRLTVLRVDYIFRYNNLIHYELIGNIAPDFRSSMDESVFVANSVWGCGVGMKILTPLGSAKLIASRGHIAYSNGDHDDQYHLNLLFRAGF